MRKEHPKHMVPAAVSRKRLGGGVLPAAAIAAGSVLVSTAVATPALAEEATAPAAEAVSAQVTTQAPATAEQTQQSAQKAYDDAA